MGNPHDFGDGRAVTHDAYVPALDGLRAFAVAAVIAYHFGAGWAPGGFLGVDAFFVLSGFLITSLLLTEWGRSSRISLPGFWARRARRLLPALLVVLGAIALYAAVLAPASQLDTLRGDGISSLFYFANWHFVLSGQSYFDLFSLPSPMRHLWSLAIEEQFYLVWPLVVLVCLRVGRGSRKVLAGVCVAGIAASVAVMALLLPIVIVISRAGTHAIRSARCASARPLWASAPDFPAGDAAPLATAQRLALTPFRTATGRLFTLTILGVAPKNAPPTETVFPSATARATSAAPPPSSR